jgi:hypothetical protein
VTTATAEQADTTVHSAVSRHPAALDRDTRQRWDAARTNLEGARVAIAYTLASAVNYIDWVCMFQADEVPVVADAVAQHLHELVEASLHEVIARWQNRTGANPAALSDLLRDDPRYAAYVRDLLEELAAP